MSWSRPTTPFLLYWAERCGEVIEADQAAIADRVADGKKATAGQLAGIELQTSVLAAIRRELDRRANV